MSAEYPDRLTGIGVRIPRISAETLYQDDCAYSEAGPHMGVATGTSRMRVDGSGAPPELSGRDNVYVRAHTAGVAGRDGATVIARIDSGEWTGWDPPSVLRGRQVMAVISGTTTSTETVSTLAIPGGALLVAEARESGGLNTIRVWRKGDPEDTFTSSTVAVGITASSKPCHPTLLHIGDDRVLLLFLEYETGLAQVTSVYSANGGISWSSSSSYILRDPIDTTTTTIERMRAACSAGQVLLVMGLTVSTAKVVGQWSSADLGSSFTFVENAVMGTGLGTKAPDVVAVPGGGFCVVATGTSTAIGGSTQYPVSATVGSAIDSLTTAVTSAFDDVFDTYDGDDLKWQSVAIDDTGAIWRHVMGYSSGGGADALGIVGVSYDGGGSWVRVGGSTTAPREWWIASDGTSFPWYGNTCFAWGSVYLSHRFRKYSAAMPYGMSPAVLRLGGYAQVTQAPAEAFQSRTNPAAWALTYAGMASPADYGLVLTDGVGGSPTVTEVALGNGWATTEATGVAHFYFESLTVNHNEGFIARLVINRTNANIYIKAAVSDGANVWGVDIEWTSASVCTIIDLGGGFSMPIQSATVTQCTEGMDLIIAVSAAGVTVVAQPHGGTEQEQWTLQSALTSTAGTYEGIRWGTVSDGNPPNTFTTIAYCRMTISQYAANFANSFVSPDDLRGFPLSPVARYFQEGVSLAGTGGPANPGEILTIPVVYDYPISAIFSDSPLDEWRSTGAGFNTLAWELETLDDGIAPTEGLMFVYVDNVNFKRFVLEQDDGLGGSAYSIELADVSLTTAFTMRRTGHQVRPGGGTTVAGPYVRPNELVGSQLEFASGEIVPIIANTEGFLTSGTTVAEKRCTITVEQDTVTNGTDLTGTATIWHKRAVVYIHGAEDSTGRIRMRIHPDGEPDPFTGDFRAGIIEIGQIRPFGRAYDWGRQIGYRSNVTVTELPNGTTRARKNGERRRSVSLSWNEGLLTCEAAQSPVYSAPGSLVASSRGTPYVIANLPDGDEVVTYHPSIPASDDGAGYSVHVLGDCAGVIRLRLNGEPMWEGVRGTEGVDEVVHIQLSGEEVL